VIDLRFIDDLSRRISNAMPPAARDVGKDVEKNVRAILHAGFEKLELVTRDEFELQTRVLEQTRARLRDLETQVDELEKRVGGTV
jgi:hypothetical protein